MAETNKLQCMLSLSLPPPLSQRKHFPSFPSRLSFYNPKCSRPLRVLMMAVKRSPKRLKYSSQRFFKEDGMLFVEADPSGADSWKLDPIIELLKQGAVGVIPTDTVYGTATAKYASRKNVGVRVPDDAICQAILEKMDAPLMSTSVKSPKENEWMIDPVVIAETYGPEGLDFVVDAGVRVADPSTVVDMTGPYAKIIRQGKGPKLHWMVADDDVPESGFGAEDLIPSAT